MDLKMNVYTPGLELIGVLEKYKSVIWEDKAFTAGSFSVDAYLDESTRPLLAEENIIWLEGETAGIIEHYEASAENYGTYITVKGRLLTGILDRRILWGLYNLSGTAPEIMHYLVEDCCITPTRGDTAARKIPGLTPLLAPSSFDKLQIQKTGGSLLDALEEIGRTYKVAFGVQFNPAVPQMEFWTRPCTDRSVNQNINEQVFYSTELDDVLSSAYSYDSISWRNVALVAGEGEGADRKHVVVEIDSGTQEVSAVGFVALGDSSPMRTSNGEPIKVLALTADGDYYQSAYTGAQIDEAIRRVLSGETGGNGSAANGLPAGGTTGQFLAKRSAASYDVYWTDVPKGGGVTMDEVNAAIQEAISNLPSGGGSGGGLRLADFNSAVNAPFNIEVLES